MEKLKVYFFYITVFISGAVILVIEILGTRVLAPFYGSTIFVWSSLISVTLGFLALGYFIGGKIADKKPELSVFYLIIFLAGLFVSIIMKIDQPVLVFTDRFGLRSGPLVASLILFAVPLFLLGMTSPFAIRLRTKFLQNVGGVSGNIFAFSTVGSLLGALLAGFFLIPILSISEIFLIAAVLLIGLSMLGLFFVVKLKRIVLVFMIFILFSIALAVIVIPKSFYKDVRHTLKVIYQEQSFYGDLKIIETSRIRCLVVDGANQSCFFLETKKPGFAFIQEIQRIVENIKPQSILLLGFGGGSVFKSLPESQSIDAVEIDPQIVSLAERYFDFQLTENRSLFIDDARHFLRVNPKKYDLIIMNLALGNAFPAYMFNKEAFSSIKQNLKHDGLVLVKLEGRSANQDRRLISSLIETARLVFPSIVLTTTDLEDYTTVLLHFSPKADYVFDSETGVEKLTVNRFVEDKVNPQDATILTDDYNPLDILSIPYLTAYLEAMKRLGGYRILFSI